MEWCVLCAVTIDAVITGHVCNNLVINTFITVVVPRIATRTLNTWLCCTQAKIWGGGGGALWSPGTHLEFFSPMGLKNGP